MRRSVPLLAAALMIIVLGTSPAAAFDEMTGVTMTMAPSEATSGADISMAVILHNANGRDLIITSLTIQVYDGVFFDPSNEYKMYHINPDDGVVPANGSKEFDVTGKAPAYMGMCSVMVTVAGSFDGDGEGVENASIGTFTSSLTLNPNVGGFVLAGALMIIVPVVLLAVAAVIAVWYFEKRRA